DLPKPFHVLATQNPLEQEGTYPLPEAQLDRFLLQIDVGYPDLDAEKKMLVATTFGDETTASAVMTANDLMNAQAIVRRLAVGAKVVNAILGRGRAARPGEEGGKYLRELRGPGAGPRASRALM